MNRAPFLVPAFALAAVAAILAGCNGDALATGTLPVATPPPPGRSAFSTAVHRERLPLPPTAGFAGRIFIPAASIAGTRVKVFDGISPPFGTPIMQGSSYGSALAPIPLIYVAMTAAAKVQFSAAPGFWLTLPAMLGTSGFNFYVGYFNPRKPLSGYESSFEGPAVVSGQQIRFSEGFSPLKFDAHQTYCFAVYEVPIPTPSPSPTPTS